MPSNHDVAGLRPAGKRVFCINVYHWRASLAPDAPRTMQVPWIRCADGFKMSVQASSYHYSDPKRDHAWPYETFEVGFPSQAEDLLVPYSQMTVDPDDSDKDLLSDVYPWVPADVINDIVRKHGGYHHGN